jgi:hypothetical protein
MLIDQLQIPGITLIIGKTQSGKSHLLRYLMKCLWLNGSFAFGCIISLTSQFTHDWDCIPKRFHLTPDKAEHYLKTILLPRMAQIKARGINMPSFILIEDCLGELKWNDSFWTQLATTVRHYNISLFLTTQYLKKIPSVIRSQCSQYFFLKMMNQLELKGAYEQCFSMVMDYKTFLQFILENTQNYKSIFVNNHSLDNSDIVQVIQAPNSISPFYMRF